MPLPTTATVRRVRRSLLLTVSAGLLVLVASVVRDLDGFLADTPLGATADRRGVAGGEPVTGSVEHPDGAITVTLVRDTLPRPRPSRHTEGGVTCDYDEDEATYACPTVGLRPGVYRVEVTDAAFASEGTKIVTVGVGPPGRRYAPDIAVRGGGGRVPDAADGPGGSARPDGTAVLELSGWEPGRRVTLTLLEVTTGRVERGRGRLEVVPGPDGGGTITVGPLPPGSYWPRGRDGAWDDRLTEGWTRGFLVVEPQA